MSFIGRMGVCDGTNNRFCRRHNLKISHGIVTEIGHDHLARIFSLWPVSPRVKFD
jgi:hypothetical protein